MSFSYQIEQKRFIEASCTNNLHTGKKVFYNCYIWMFVCLYFSDRVRKLGHNLVCMCSLYISREERNKHRSKFSQIVFYVFWAFTCSKLTIETLEQGVKYVQS